MKSILRRLSPGMILFGIVMWASPGPANDVVEVYQPIDDQPGYHQAFSHGEKVKIRVTYLGTTAGYITIEVHETTWEGKEVYELRMDAESAGIAYWMYPVNAQLISYMDRDSLFSWGYDYHKNQGGDKETEKVRYDQKGGVVYENGEQEGPIPDETQDVLSAIYYMRTQPFDVGDEYRFPVYVGGEPYSLKITVKEVEKVATKDGWEESYRLVPEVEREEQKKDVSEKLQEDSPGLEVWISKDDRRVPLLISLPATFGTLYGYLDSYKPGEKNTD